MMPLVNVLKRLLAAAALLPLLFSPLRAQAFGWPNTNDNIFPPQPEARASISFDGKGFLIHGQRTFIAAGEFQYSRTPRAQWRDRMLRIKRAGYNALQTYCFWSYHEPREGQFDFTGDKDIDAYLKLAHSLGLYVIVRLGPYVNSEWDSGGLPIWLRFKPGLLPMQENAPFYQALDPYFAKLVPIIAANQINHGGAVILVQMENEHHYNPPQYEPGSGGGTDMPTPYYHWFHDKMLRMGLQVPLFFSGLNHNDDPAGDVPFDTSLRPSPWFSTEFWTGWYGLYGSPPDRAAKLERATSKVIAYGGSGYAHYIMAGGTNFDAWNSNEQGASYDFCAPIGQTGDLRDVYYRMKRAATFATSFPRVIEDSVASDGGNGVTATNSSVHITNRRGPSGEILFLDNPGDSPQATQIRAANGTIFPAAGPVTLSPGEIMPIVAGYPLLPGVNLRLSAARILGISSQGQTTTVVIYGAAGEPAEMHFSAPSAALVQQPPGKPSALSLNPNHTVVTLKTKFPTGAPTVSIFRIGKLRVRILAMNSDLADRTWFLMGGAMIACGPDYVGETIQTSGSIRLVTEQRGLSQSTLTRTLLLFGAGAPISLSSPPGAGRGSVSGPSLGPWSIARDAPAPPEAQPAFNDRDWKTSSQPLPMGADGDYGPFAWYRTKIIAPGEGVYQLNLSDAGDWVTCFVNGSRTASTDIQTRFRMPAPRHMLINLRKGLNSLAFFTAHYGRNKLYDYYGPLDNIDVKGISGSVTLSRSSGSSTDNLKFRWQADDAAPGDAAKFAAPGLDTAGLDWHDADTTTDVFNGRVGWAWFRITLPQSPGPHRRIHFNSIDDNGEVFLNGKQIATDVGVNAQADISLDDAWNANGPNVLAVAVQNTSGGGGLLGDVRFDAGIPMGLEIAGWKMRGGITQPTAWKPNNLPGGLGSPGFYQSSFTTAPPGVSVPHPVLRASLTGMSRGTAWLNGHNLGRYPERSPVDGLYLPESWLLPGKNILTVFDEEGNSPSQVKIIVEEAASRTGYVFTESRP